MPETIHDILHVEWTITPKHPPRPVLGCSTCGGHRPYSSSGRIRLNANGKRLDAWLIYRCSGCDGTWNRPIFERQALRTLDPAMLEAMQESAPEVVARLAFDIEALKARANRIEESDEVDVRTRVVSAPAAWRRIAITFILPYAASLRLDRLLAAELGLSRSRLQALVDRGEIEIEPVRKDALKRPVRDGATVLVDLRDESERLAAGARVRGG